MKFFHFLIFKGGVYTFLIYTLLHYFFKHYFFKLFKHTLIYTLYYTFVEGERYFWGKSELG